jgi:putative SOS response-associated peptidase YedK
MCGRFTLASRPEAIAAEFGSPSVPVLEPRFNVAPTQGVAAVRLDPATGRRRLDLLRWGLVPAWADDPAIGNRLINARAETLAERAAFRRAFLGRRCLILSDGFYEFIWTILVPLRLRRGPCRSHESQPRHDTRPV